MKDNTSILFLGCLIVLSIGICNGVFIKADAPEIEYVGRVNISSGLATFDWSNVQISTNFAGSYLAVQLKDEGNIYNAFVDGKLYQVFETKPGVTKYLISNSLPSGQHTITLTKRTEAFVGIATFIGFEVSSISELKVEPEASSRRIEFIGDSISCGYGDEGTAPCPFTPATENAYLTYGPLIARAVNADVFLECWSGKGMVRNYGYPNVTSPDPFPIYYPRTLANDPNLKWNFQSWIPQAVVINLGTNDYSTTPHPPQPIYTNAYHTFIANLFTQYGLNTQIFAVCGPLIGNPCCQYIQDLVSQYGGKGVHYINLQGILNSNDYGCDGHPNLSGHQKMAQVSLPVIKQVMGW